jgi:non-ribosomal peptide synthetase component E (peptide arylation enzyme)
LKVSEESVKEPPAHLVPIRKDGLTIAKLDPATGTLWFRARHHGEKRDVPLSIWRFLRMVGAAMQARNDVVE